MTYQISAKSNNPSSSLGNLGLRSLSLINCNECWTRQSEWPVARGSSTVVWHNYYTPTFTGFTCLSASSTNSCMMMRRCQDSGRHWSTVSGGASRQHLRSAAIVINWECRHNGESHGGRAFAVVGPSTWNSLPKRLRDPSFSISVLAVFSKHIPFLRILTYLEVLSKIRCINLRFTLHYITMMCVWWVRAHAQHIRRSKHCASAELSLTRYLVGLSGNVLRVSETIIHSHTNLQDNPI